MKDSSLKSGAAAPHGVPHRWIDSGVARPTVEADGALPIVAGHPDAAPSQIDTVVRVAVHSIALIVIVSFLAYYCLWVPLKKRVTAPPQAPPQLRSDQRPGVNRVLFAGEMEHEKVCHRADDSAEPRAHRELYPSGLGAEMGDRRTLCS